LKIMPPKQQEGRTSTKHAASAAVPVVDPPPVEDVWRSKIRASLKFSVDPENPERVELEEARWNRCHAAMKALEAGLGAPLFVLTKARQISGISSGQCDLHPIHALMLLTVISLPIDRLHTAHYI
jgi:hypothetical protein